MRPRNRVEGKDVGAQAAQETRQTSPDGFAHVCQELEVRANAGATLSELDSLLVRHTENPGITRDEYNELWLYAWALLHRPRRTWGEHAENGHEQVAPG
jgi:hypothetical protein